MSRVLIFLVVLFFSTGTALSCGGDYLITKVGGTNLRIKAGVKMQGVRNEMLFASMVAEPIWNKYGAELVITSGREGKHHKYSDHARGDALDYRTRDFKKEDIPKVAAELQQALWDDHDLVNFGATLGPGESVQSEYQVVIEGNHLHVGFHPIS